MTWNEREKCEVLISIENCIHNLKSSYKKTLGSDVYTGKFYQTLLLWQEKFYQPEAEFSRKQRKKESPIFKFIFYSISNLIFWGQHDAETKLTTSGTNGQGRQEKEAGVIYRWRTASWAWAQMNLTNSTNRMHQHMNKIFHN
jgi:hypothetical protein